jgi:hypothetical protein
MAENDKIYTGNLDTYRANVQKFDELMAAEKISVESKLVAAAIRAGFSEVAIEMSQVRRYGTGQRKAA